MRVFTQFKYPINHTDTDRILLLMLNGFVLLDWFLYIFSIRNIFDLLISEKFFSCSIKSTIDIMAAAFSWHMLTHITWMRYTGNRYVTIRRRRSTLDVAGWFVARIKLWLWIGRRRISPLLAMNGWRQIGSDESAMTNRPTAKKTHTYARYSVSLAPTANPVPTRSS